MRTDERDTLVVLNLVHDNCRLTSSVSANDRLVGEVSYVKAHGFPVDANGARLSDELEIWHESFVFPFENVSVGGYNVKALTDLEGRGEAGRIVSQDSDLLYLIHYKQMFEEQNDLYIDPQLIIDLPAEARLLARNIDQLKRNIEELRNRKQLQKRRLLSLLQEQQKVIRRRDSLRELKLRKAQLQKQVAQLEQQAKEQGLVVQ